MSSLAKTANVNNETIDCFQNRNHNQAQQPEIVEIDSVSKPSKRTYLREYV